MPESPEAQAGAAASRMLEADRALLERELQSALLLIIDIESKIAQAHSVLRSSLMRARTAR